MTDHSVEAPTPSLSRPSDPPAVFREDRRGKTPRTEKDYAELAVSYLALAGSKRKAAAIWAERFGRSPQRWRMDLAKAKGYIEKMPTGDLRLTSEGEGLVYGENAALDIEAAHIAAQTWVDLVRVSGAHQPPDKDRSAARNRAMRKVEKWAARHGLSPREALERLLGEAEAREAAADAFFYPNPAPDTE